MNRYVDKHEESSSSKVQKSIDSAKRELGKTWGEGLNSIVFALANCLIISGDRILPQEIKRENNIKSVEDNKVSYSSERVKRAIKDFSDFKKSFGNAGLGSLRFLIGLKDLLRYGAEGGICSFGKWATQKAIEAEKEEGKMKKYDNSEEILDLEEISDKIVERKKIAKRKVKTGLRKLTGAKIAAGNTVLALGYLLGSAAEITSLNKNGRNKERNLDEKYSKVLLATLKEIMIGTKNSLFGIIKSGGYGIDILDKMLGKKIEDKMNEKGRNTTGIIREFLRNNILKLMIAISLASYGGYKGTQTIMKWYDSRQVEIKKNSNETLLIPTREYPSLQGKKITIDAPLTRRYLGGDLANSGDLIVGDTLTLNSANSLHNLWTQKIQKCGNFTKDISKLDSINTVNMTEKEIEDFRLNNPLDATYLFVIKPYIDGEENKGTMTLEQFIQETNQIVEKIKSDTKSYDGGLKGAKKDLFEAIKEDINGECLVAYSMTELCENKVNGEFNKELFDILLKNAGTNYISKVPAIYDGKTSYGFYQFTAPALQDAVLVAKKTDAVKIPGSIIDLKSWEDQTKAAYLFALYNLKSAVNKLTNQQAKALLSYQSKEKEKFRDNITQLIAMCHHRPATSSEALWKRQNGGYKKDIYYYGDRYTKPYGMASKINYESLK